VAPFTAGREEIEDLMVRQFLRRNLRRPRTFRVWAVGDRLSVHCSVKAFSTTELRDELAAKARARSSVCSTPETMIASRQRAIVPLLAARGVAHACVRRRGTTNGRTSYCLSRARPQQLGTDQPFFGIAAAGHDVRQ
jgi:hypothetical protein